MRGRLIDHGNRNEIDHVVIHGADLKRGNLPTYLPRYLFSLEPESSPCGGHLFPPRVRDELRCSCSDGEWSTTWHGSAASGLKKGERRIMLLGRNSRWYSWDLGFVLRTSSYASSLAWNRNSEDGYRRYIRDYS